ncbi:ABC transporter ATP-binding protein [uncultured Clostridium sp.]|uniref:ABC transporter ATP-binding protein n=1 Tax=uncultured Clostridium sp. TaxID=59620 RepID=UPI0026153210|nr:ABC transporter ATP-binding protein [uncultured Clostridium sp.]
MEVLKVRNLTKIYSAFKGAKEVRALNGLNFIASEGDFIGIMGSSGSGKTTLLNILSGVDTATSGDVIIGDKNISSFKKDELSLFRRRSIGYIFQDFNLLDSLTLEENIGLPLILDKKNPKEITEKVDEVMKFFEIAEYKKKYPYNISGGQKQRTAAARAIINKPSIIFADEPTGNLDSKSADSLMQTISKMNIEIKSTVLMVTHDPFAASFCKKIIFIKDGTIKMEIASNGNRKEFLDKILEVQGFIGGGE